MERFKIHIDKGPRALVNELLAAGENLEDTAVEIVFNENEHTGNSTQSWADYFAEEDEEYQNLDKPNNGK